VQSPSLAVFGAAYKIVSYQSKDLIDVQTVGLGNVARHNELFPLYQVEYDYLQGSSAAGDIAKRWNRNILDSKSYGEFTRTYFGELSRLRFMSDYWPCEMKEAAMALDARQMLILSQLQTRVTLAQLKDNPSVLPLTASCAAKGTVADGAVAASQLTADWATATAKAEQGHSGQPETGGLRQDQRLRVLRRLPPHRVRRRAGPARHGRGARGAVQGVDGGVPGVAGGDRQSGGATVGPEPGAGGVPGAVQAGVRDPEGLGSGKPSDHFTIDLKAQKLSNVSNSGLSFN
jgi:hypothetical protein